MRRTILSIGAAAILATLGFLAWQFRGAGPAILPAPPLPPPSPSGSNNTTGLPLTIPDGFSIFIFARDLGKPRDLIEDPRGTILVSVPERGAVYALPDDDRDGSADRTIIVREGLNLPHGLALKCDPSCTLFIAETNRVAAYSYDPDARAAAGDGRTITALPDRGNHWTRSLLLLDDNRTLLVSIGSSCNVCNEKDARRASIQAIDLVTGEMRPFASGLRNSVFMVIHPSTGDVWATEMGRDLLGDDLPPDEVNIIRSGQHYGWPLCYGRNVLDTDFHTDDHVHIRPDCTAPFETPSFIDIPAHSAPLGLAFTPQSGSPAAAGQAPSAWPATHADSLLVAFHGSWNRSVPTGYKIVSYDLRTDGPYPTAEDFITGWLSDGQALGRPVGLLIAQDRTLYISDDKAGVIYRVAPRG